MTAGLAYASQTGGTYNESSTLTRNGLTVVGSTAVGHNTPVTIKGVGDTAVRTVTGQTTWQCITFDGSANTNRDRAVVNTSGGLSTFEACIIGPGQRLVVEPRQILSDNGNPTILTQQVSALLE